MAKYTVSCDLLVPVLIELDAASEGDALEALHTNYKKTELLALANTEESSIGIVDGSETIEPAP